jgi:hypothetical protein
LSGFENRPDETRHMTEEQDVFLAYVTALGPVTESMVTCRVVQSTDCGKGYGMFSTQSIENGETVACYAGCYLFHRHFEYSQKSHALLVAIEDNIGYAICGRVISPLVRSGRLHPYYCGAMINSTQNDANEFIDEMANVKLDRSSCVFMHEIGRDTNDRVLGFAAVPVVATRHIEPGEQLMFSYAVTPEADMSPSRVCRLAESGREKRTHAKKNLKIRPTAIQEPF